MRDTQIEERLRRFAAVPDLSDWQDVVRRADTTQAPRNLPARRLRLPRRPLIAAVALAVALAVPALAFSGVLGALFGFSNQGTPVPPSDFSRVSAELDVIKQLTGAPPGTFVQLASRNGWTFYAAQAVNGDTCYFAEPSAQSQSSGVPNANSGSCKNAAGNAEFPSPSQPVFNMSHYVNNSSIVTLAGVAADGVASVQVLAASDCHVVATAPVVGNVYIADNLPLTPEAQIVARDADGNTVWHQAVTAASDSAIAPSCGLG